MLHLYRYYKIMDANLNKRICKLSQNKNDRASYVYLIYYTIQKDWVGVLKVK